MKARVRLPSMSALRSFEAAARHNSFTHAAAELAVSQGAISRQIKDLEQMVGTPLFRRVGRAVVATKAGEALAQELTKDLDSLSVTIRNAISAGTHDSVIRMSVLPTFGARWLVPRLNLFAETFPSINLQVVTRDRPFNMADEKFDLAIHFGEQDWPGVEYTPLCYDALVAVVSPALAQGDRIEEIIARSTLLELEARTGDWRRWLDTNGIKAPVADRRMQFDRFSMTIAGALHSIGVALLPTYLIQDELESGQLIQLGNKSVETDRIYYVARKAGDENPNIAKITAWFQAEIRDNVVRVPV